MGSPSHLAVLTTASIVAFAGMTVSVVRLSLQATWTLAFLIPVSFMVAAYCVAQFSGSFTPRFDVRRHHRLVAA